MLLELHNTIILKHREKGVSHRTLELQNTQTVIEEGFKPDFSLWDVLQEEVGELEREIIAMDLEKIKTEALHVSLCGLLIADWALQRFEGDMDYPKQIICYKCGSSYMKAKKSLKTDPDGCPYEALISECAMCGSLQEVDFE